MIKQLSLPTISGVTLVEVVRNIVWIVLGVILISVERMFGLPVLSFAFVAVLASLYDGWWQRIAAYVVSALILGTVYVIPYYLAGLLIGITVGIDRLHPHVGNKVRWRIVAAILSSAAIWLYRPIPLTPEFWLYHGCIVLITIISLYGRAQVRSKTVQVSERFLHYVVR